ncbi:DUF899 domain-containing protein [Parasphingorhabdus litoris]|uniref:DUF899 domain-containing protein n=1 Tax=Parasphingorhabdus litoris TaxID=394733 RepID=A0ABN1AJ63_9SPHN|nr:DUF899 domain-containing protein [Parasphingorhabdus litoris]
MTETALPEIVTPAEWQAHIDSLRIKEKELTRAHDALNAMRRQLPMVKIEKEYAFQGESGTQSLFDLFEGRKQLIVYHFMFGPDADAGCPGCSWVTDAMSHPAHLNARDTSLVLVSRAPLEKLLAYRKRMGWGLPWVSSFGSDFNYDFNATNDEGENHVASVFLRDGDDVYRTYYTDQRGVEHLGSHWTWLDLTPYGRQEPWEETPEGWPKGEMFWDRRHDEYGE